MHYVIMPKYAMNLSNLFENEQFSKAASLSLGKQLLDALEEIHETGYVYNDLKLENLMISKDFNLYSSISNVFESNGIILINFGSATRYLKKDTGQHKSKKKTNELRGNVLFASPNQLNFKTTSRRDDLISLYYFMVYLLNGGSIPGV